MANLVYSLNLTVIALENKAWYLQV